MRAHWRAKVAGKILLARMPVAYSAWRRTSLFRLGEMDDPTYAIGVFERHFQRSGLENETGFTVLELGPGDSVASSIVSCAHGAERTVLIDVGAFATADMGKYREVGAMLRDQGYQVPDLDSVSTVAGLLDSVGGEYLTCGLASLRGLPDDSVDFVWSHAVLEHVPRDEFDDTIHELTRVLKPNGRMSHRIDFQDHLSESINSLRFTGKRWESRVFRTSGFYTNRLRIGEVTASFEQSGLAYRLESVDMWDNLPVSRRDLAEPYRHMPDRELLVRGVDLIAWHKA